MFSLLLKSLIQNDAKLQKFLGWILKKVSIGAFQLSDKVIQSWL